MLALTIVTTYIQHGCTWGYRMGVELCPGLGANQRLAIQHLAPSYLERGLSPTCVVYLLALLHSDQPDNARISVHLGST